MTPVYGTSSAAAPALQFEHAEPVQSRAPEPRPIAVEGGSQSRKTPVYQPSLFNSRELPRLVQFETFAPESVQPRSRKSSSAPRTRNRKIIPGQTSLEFSAPRPVEGVIYCDAPVAIPAHRAMAAALDASVVLMAIAAFTFIFLLAGGELVITATTAPLLVGIIAIVTLFYKLLWCLADGDTAGMRWTRLRLVNFDGKSPGRRYRLYRMASGILSILAAGLGLLWVLVDEETLTWHDHISKSFPTPY